MKYWFAFHVVCGLFSGCPQHHYWDFRSNKECSDFLDKKINKEGGSGFCGRMLDDDRAR